MISSALMVTSVHTSRMRPGQGDSRPRSAPDGQVHATPSRRPGNEERCRVRCRRDSPLRSRHRDHRRASASRACIHGGAGAHVGASAAGDREGSPGACRDGRTGGRALAGTRARSGQMHIPARAAVIQKDGPIARASWTKRPNDVPPVQTEDRWSGEQG